MLDSIYINQGVFSKRIFWTLLEKMNSFPTYIPELDQMILLQMNMPQIQNICEAFLNNPYVSGLCTSIWRQLVIRDFGLKVAQLKPINESYFQQYRYLSKSIIFKQSKHHQAKHLSRKGRLDAVALTIDPEDPYWGYLSGAIARGQTHVIEWLYQNYPEMFTNEIICRGLLEGFDSKELLRSLDWLEQRNLIDYEEIVNCTYKSEIKEWFNQRGYSKDESNSLDIRSLQLK
jgi:hypothetical protein